MKYIFTICFLCSAALCSFAQTGKQELPILTVGGQVSIPVGTYSDVYNTGYGASLKCEVPLNPNKFYLTIGVGYQHFSYSSAFKQAVSASTSGAGFVPLKGGVKFYPAGGFFVDGQAGVAISTAGNGGTGFAWSPGMGYALSGNLEIAVRYESWSNDESFNQVGLHLAYRFKQYN